jgi:hypothetical protein
VSVVWGRSFVPWVGVVGLGADLGFRFDHSGDL